MSYKNLKKTALTAAFTLAGLALAPFAQVSAQAQVCVPGPYNICPPNTDIVIGGVRISDTAIVALIVVYAIGMTLLINGSVLTNKLKALKNRN